MDETSNLSATSHASCSLLFNITKYGHPLYKFLDKIMFPSSDMKTKPRDPLLTELRRPIICYEGSKSHNVFIYLLILLKLILIVCLRNPSIFMENGKPQKVYIDYSHANNSNISNIPFFIFANDMIYFED